MTFKTITRRGRDWLWPEYDTELIKVFDQADDIGTILEYCPKRRVAIQAGGACGVWPWRLSEHFGIVYTFEPDPTNYRCLLGNAVFDNPNIVNAIPAALSENIKRASLGRHLTEASNAGAGYILDDPTGQVYTVALDYFLPEGASVDLIQLDVEGMEASALMGAALLIEDNKPTIVIEEKPLPQGGDHLAARRLLESCGYKERARIHRDVIFTHG